MNLRLISLSCLLYWANFMVQQGESTAEWITIGSVAYSTTGLITGVAFLKAAALGVLALVSLKGNRRGQHGHGHGHGYGRGKREIGGNYNIDSIEEDVLEKETEAIFRHLDETDPAHCFRRFFCDLSTGKMDTTTDDHIAILNLVAQPQKAKSAAFEYGIAASVGRQFGSLDVCEALYDCHLSGKEIDQFFV